ncbi:MAG: hypothetical protein KDA52_17375 [Planctomycetaceae bacterium]|nr:hypothetical protein [Planctomycetaceae bacterium]
MQPADSPSGTRVALLIVAFAVIGLVWCVVLPWVATLPEMQRQLTFLDERGIDPSAMFYTELEVMTPILDELEKSPSQSVPATK